MPVRAAPRRSVRPGDVVVARPFEQVNLVLGVNGLTRTDDRRYALGVLNAALGGGTSRRLFQEVREQRGLAYSVYSYASTTPTPACSAVAVGCLPARSTEVLAVVRTELAKVADDGISERGAAARPGPAPRRAGASARGLRLADVADRQGGAGLRRAAQHRQVLAAGRRTSPSRTSTRWPADLFTQPQTLAVVGPFDTLPA